MRSIVRRAGISPIFSLYCLRLILPLFSCLLSLPRSGPCARLNSGENKPRTALEGRQQIAKQSRSQELDTGLIDPR